MFAVLALANSLVAQSTAPVRFRAVDVFIDSGASALAAYQFELKAFGADVKIVGVEGGEHGAFAAPPYYDPAALKGGRIVLAAFHTGADVPKGRTRVATVHLQITGKAAPEYDTTLIIAGTPTGERISAKITLEHRKGAQP